MKPVTTLIIPADGRTATGLYTDGFDLRELGPLTVERASTITFHSSKQLWQVHEELPAWQRKSSEFHATLLFENPSRERCLDWEREHFTQ
jgi:hypothetical protein